jgi:acyl-CoA thioesterase I
MIANLTSAPSAWPALLIAVLIAGFATPIASPTHVRAAEGSRGPLRVVALGDSLTAGFGIGPADAFPAQLEMALKARGHDIEISNAGVSGDTTAGGLARLDWAVPDGTEAVIIELGANDMLRGLDPGAARRNLEAIITRIKAKRAAVLLTGMRSVGNWGADYVKSFDAIFPELAAKYELPFYPFFLEGVAGRAGLNQPDGLHPNRRGVAAIVGAILPTVEPWIARAKAARPPG